MRQAIMREFASVADRARVIPPLTAKRSMRDGRRRRERRNAAAERRNE